MMEETEMLIIWLLLLTIFSFVFSIERSKQRHFGKKYVWGIRNYNWSRQEFCYDTEKSPAEVIQALADQGCVGDYSYRFASQKMELFMQNDYTGLSSKWRLTLMENNDKTLIRLHKIEGHVNEKDPILVLTPFCAEVLAAEPALYFEE